VDESKPLLHGSTRLLTSARGASPAGVPAAAVRRLSIRGVAVPPGRRTLATAAAAGAEGGEAPAANGGRKGKVRPGGWMLLRPRRQGCHATPLMSRGLEVHWMKWPRHAPQALSGAYTRSQFSST
jgi:hypothetical protein